MELEILVGTYKFPFWDSLSSIKYSVQNFCLYVYNIGEKTT